MKWVFSVCLMLVNCASLADTTSNKQICIELDKNRDAIRKKLNQNSNEFWNQKYKATFEEYSRLCKDNDQTKSPYSVVIGNKRVFYNPFNSVAISDMSSFAAMYDGEKQSAWQSYYKMPKACRVKNPSTSDFVTCSENKTKQKEAFEAYWSSKMTSANKAANYDLKHFFKRGTESELILANEVKNTETHKAKREYFKELLDKSSYLTAIGLFLCFLLCAGLTVCLLKRYRAKSEVVLKITPQITSIDKHCPYCLSPLLYNNTTQEYRCSDEPKCEFNSSTITA